MEIIETKLSGCLIIQPKIFADDRGYFLETFNAKTFAAKTGMHIQFVQDNESKSSFGVVRGLHMQTGEHAQAKLVSVTKGKVLDVAVDMRKDSPTFLQHVAVELSEQNKTQLFVPRGFAHGFVVLQDETIFSYKCDNFYNQPSEAGLHLGDESLGINWIVPANNWVMSAKDKALPSVEDYLRQLA
jgi:dTDP-4-dehydrorhamnose 3,5-epimerase